MNDTTKNTLLVVMAVVTVASLAFAYKVWTQKSGSNLGKGLTFVQATEIKNTVESLKTDQEKTAYLNSKFKTPVQNQPLVSFNTSQAKTDWCSYAGYYQERMMEAYEANNMDLFHAYRDAQYQMSNNAANAGQACDL